MDGSDAAGAGMDAGIGEEDCAAAAAVVVSALDVGAACAAADGVATVLRPGCDVSVAGVRSATLSEKPSFAPLQCK
jgi:hypothetical protein